MDQVPIRKRMVYIIEKGISNKFLLYLSSSQIKKKLNDFVQSHGET